MQRERGGDIAVSNIVRPDDVRRACVVSDREAAILASPELTLGAPNGVLADDFLVWSEGPYAYADYVFRGASKAARLVDPPVGYRDI